MRTLFVCIFAVALIAGCNNEDKKAPGAPAAGGTTITDTTQFTTIQWLDSTNKDFGKIQEGQKLEVAFRLKNTGDKPLVIERVQPSCGCTVAEQPTEPIQPGGESQVKATFNSEHKAGINHKSLTVYANTKPSRASSLQFVVEVIKAGEAEKK